jgi:hypothetical protein
MLAKRAPGYSGLGFALPGTLADPMTRCGRANCRRAAEPERQPPESVGSARLTCGQHPQPDPVCPGQPKREDLSRSEL